MAVIGARPAAGIGGIGRRPRTRPRARSVSPSRLRRSASRRRGAIASISTTLVAITAAAGLGLFYLSQSTHVAAIGYQIDALEARAAALRAEEQQLTYQIGEARSPSTVEERATRDLKLVSLDPQVIRFAPTSIDPRLVK